MNVNGNDDMYKAMSVSKVRKVVVRVAGSSKLTIIWPEKYSPEVLRMGLAVTGVIPISSPSFEGKGFGAPMSWRVP